MHQCTFKLVFKMNSSTFEQGVQSICGVWNSAWLMGRKHCFCHNKLLIVFFSIFKSPRPVRKVSSVDITSWFECTLWHCTRALLCWVNFKRRVHQIFLLVNLMPVSMTLFGVKTAMRLIASFLRYCSNVFKVCPNRFIPKKALFNTFRH